MNFSAALFAGGRSSRMGCDKAFLEIDGVPLWRRQLKILRALAPSEIFIAGPPRPEWVEGDLEIVADAAPEGGPLGGLISVLRRCKNPRVLVLAVDLPNMKCEFLQQLLALNTGVVPQNAGRFEPLAAVYPTTCLALAESSLTQGELSLQQFVERALTRGFVSTKNIVPAEKHLFFNLNSPADLAAIARK